MSSAFYYHRSRFVIEPAGVLVYTMNNFIMPAEQNPFFLKKKYGDLHTAPDVARVAKRTESKTGEKVSQEPTVRIQNYLDRFKEIVERKDPAERERGVEAIKRLLYKNFVIRPSNVPESTFLLEQRLARELGHGTVEITDEFREQKINQIIADQRHSLDRWVDYLALNDAQYPDWAKYWAIRSVLEMGKFEKQEDKEGNQTAVFRSRTAETVAPFPPLNQRALAMAIGALESKLVEEKKPKTQRHPIQNQSKKLSAEAFQKLIATENFSKIYTQFLLEIPEYSTEGLQETRGKWKKYPRGSAPTDLVKSLDGHPLEWCTANPETAKTQLQGGDFYVYYSLDADGNYTIPRVAIRMQEDSIAEVRGIAPDQNLDPYIGDVVQKKMSEFPDGKVYEKKAGDMKQLTTVEKKVKAVKSLDKNELVFLYEIKNKIEGFGYGRDPRVNELRSQRNPEVDMPVVFECEQKQIARSPQEVNELTKAYVGPLFPGIFKMLGHLEHIYTAFPEGRITRYNVEIGGQSEKQLEVALERAGFKISDYARHMMKQKEFKTAKDPEQADLVRLQVGDLFGDKDVHTTDNIYKKADQLGLELCPAEVGPHLRLKLTDQPMGEWFRIAMRQITDPVGDPDIFSLVRDGGGVWLSGYWAEPASEWDSNDEFVFRLRK